MATFDANRAAVAFDGAERRARLLVAADVVVLVVGIAVVATVVVGGPATPGDGVALGLAGSLGLLAAVLLPGHLRRLRTAAHVAALGPGAAPQVVRRPAVVLPDEVPRTALTPGPLLVLVPEPSTDWFRRHTSTVGSTCTAVLGLRDREGEQLRWYRGESVPPDVQRRWRDVDTVVTRDADGLLQYALPSSVAPLAARAGAGPAPVPELRVWWYWWHVLAALVLWTTAPALPGSGAVLWLALAGAVWLLTVGVARARAGRLRRRTPRGEPLLAGAVALPPYRSVLDPVPAWLLAVAGLGVAVVLLVVAGRVGEPWTASLSLLALGLPVAVALELVARRRAS